MIFRDIPKNRFNEEVDLITGDALNESGDEEFGENLGCGEAYRINWEIR